MWAHRDMKIQIPHCLGLTHFSDAVPKIGVDPMNCAKMKSGSRFLYVTRSKGRQWESKGTA